MFEITKGYKQGKGVALYDIEDRIEHKVMQRVPKMEVVTMVEAGNISNAKIQWWQEKPIVRVQGKIELVKIDPTGTSEQHIEKRTVGNRQVAPTQHRIEKPVTQSVTHAVVTGKLSKKRPNETIFEGINKMEVDEHRKLSQTVNYGSMNTLEDLVDTMIADFRLRDGDKYKAMLAKKVKLNQTLKGMAQFNLVTTQESIAVYLMNMANLETRNTYIKYMGV